MAAWSPARSRRSSSSAALIGACATASRASRLQRVTPTLALTLALTLTLTLTLAVAVALTLTLTLTLSLT